jgi:hypothetical protein|tara:strand:+ start:100 stop:1374 length:1275 start_codon:yes stop_codon:yes gene_type:complete
MTTQVTQTLPPAYVTGIGEQFSQYLQGTQDINTSPFYVDPSSFTGDQFVAGQDQMTTDAQALSGGLGGYQSYLDSANALQTGAQDFFSANQNVSDPFMQSAAGYYDQMGQAATAGQNAGATGIANAQQQFDLMSGAAAAGQGAGDQYLQAAQGYTGPNAYQQFMSPYQQQVIDASMNAFNQQAQEQQAALGASAGNAFGGGRFGVAQGQLAADSALGGAQLQGQLLSQGFGMANQLANQAYGQQMGMGSQAMQQAGQNVGMYGQAGQGQLTSAQGQQQQALQNVGLLGQAGGVQAGMANQAQQQLGTTLGQYGALSQSQQGLGQYDMSMLGNQMNAMSQMGSQNQAYQQSILDAQQQAAQSQGYAGQQALGFMGQQLGAAYGAPASTTFQTTPGPSTMQTLLGAGTGILGILGSTGAFDRNRNT